MKAKPGKDRIYNSFFTNRSDIVLWDVFQVSNGETLRLVFESKNSSWEQGVRLACDKEVRIGDYHAKGVKLWFGHSPDTVMFTCYTEDGVLSVYNIWDRGFGPDSQSYTSGMLVEDIPNGRRYRCHDFGLEPNFDRLIFCIERLQS